MAWLWTDELAHLLIESDGVSADELIGWIERPIGIRIDDADDPVAVARRERGSEPSGPAGPDVDRGVDAA